MSTDADALLGAPSRSFIMDSQQQYSDSYKETVNGYHMPGLEVAPEPTKTPPIVYQAPYFTTPAKEPTVCGIRRTTFFLSLALAIVIIAAAVGGGVAGTIAVNNAKSSCIASEQSNNNTGAVTVTTTVTAAPSAPTGPTSTTTEPLVVPTGVVKLNCPGLKGDMPVSLGDNTWVFTPTCGIDYSGSDFGATVAYTFDDCLLACAAHNHFTGKDECTRVTFRANQTLEIPKDYGNCWLKKGSPQAFQVAGNEANLAAGAMLKTSNTGSG